MPAYNHTVIVTDLTHEHFGEELPGACVYYDIFHKGGSDVVDLFLIKTPSGEKRILSTQIDKEHYWNQRRDEQIKRLGANVGDSVMITRLGSAYNSKSFDLNIPHTISKIDSSGNIEFDDGAIKGFNSDVVKVDAI